MTKKLVYGASAGKIEALEAELNGSFDYLSVNIPPEWPVAPLKTR